MANKKRSRKSHPQPRPEEQAQQRKPRLLWANPYCLLDTSSGASMSIREMLVQLVRQGYDVQVVGATNFDAEKGAARIREYLANDLDTGKKVITVDDGPLQHRLVKTCSLDRKAMSASEERTWYQLYVNMLDYYKPDLVWFYGGHPMDLLIPHEARVRGIPSAAYLVNENYKGTRWCRDVDTIVTDTQATANLYAEQQGFRPVPVGKFIDPDRVVAEGHTRERLTFINPSPEKGAGIVVKMALMLEERRPDITFEVVESRGDWHALVETLTEVLETPRESLDNVVVTPNTDDMRPVYGRSRMLLAPSLWWESGARSLAEAMLNGVPALVSNRGGNAEMIGNAGVKIDFNPELYNPPYRTLPTSESMEPVIQFVERIFDDDAFYRAYVEAAKNHAEIHKLEASTQRLLEAFFPLIRKRAGDQDFGSRLKKIHKHGVSDKSQEPPSNKLKANRESTSEDNASEADLVTALQARAAQSETLQEEEKGLFIDCGGFDGSSSIKFMVNNPDFDCVVFEPNPELWGYYESLPVTLIKKAAYTNDGVIDFTLDTLDEDGSSLVKDKKIDYTGRQENEAFPTISADSLDLSRFMQEWKGSYDKVVLKMDIEGAEYDILEKMLGDGTLESIDKLYCEFHWYKCGVTQSRHNEILAEATKKVPVLDWDALDFSVHKRHERYKDARSIIVNEILKKKGESKIDASL